MGAFLRRIGCAAALCLFGCAGDGPVAFTTGGDFGRIQREIFDRRCTSGPCHSPQTRAGGLDLSGPAAFDELVGVEPDNPAARAAGDLRVAPFEPERSFLVRKLGGPRAGEGSRMPLGEAPLSEDEIALIVGWILDGAPRADSGDS
ncbi:MAG: hypothetical protein KatS3mg076_0614 [Candidatus Binatia bacterium]|nr:MAG: hypothetical protein KatS3mg076_0614 [Candidatus Binatia bacterium]